MTRLTKDDFEYFFVGTTDTWTLHKITTEMRDRIILSLDIMERLENRIKLAKLRQMGSINFNKEKLIDQELVKIYTGEK